jgi:hypothetical protein
MIIRASLTDSAISSGPTRARQTPPTGSERFGEILRVGGRALLTGAQAALRTIPGGEVLSAAIREGSAAAENGAASVGGAGERAAAPGEPSASGGDSNNDLWDMTRQSQEFNLMYLQLQEELSRENRRFSSLSNVLKTRHETARSVISNI